MLILEFVGLLRLVLSQSILRRRYSVAKACRTMLHHTAFETTFGFSGIIYRVEGSKALAVRILLPQNKKSLTTHFSRNYPSSTADDHPFIQELANKIQQFFQGDTSPISMNYVDSSVCKKFQLHVLMEERKIPRGMTSSYGRLALRIGTRAVRAVGSALAKNPFPVIVPCHRAIRSDRTLGGFQGGPDMKRRILEMEGVSFDSKGRVLYDDFLG